MELVDALTIIAILVGPIVAVLVTRFVDDRRSESARKYDVFRTLMRTRLIPTHVDHVAAINLVEVEFLKHPKVLSAWKAYMKNLGDEMPGPPRQDGFMKERNALLTSLLSEIATSLKLTVPQIDILMGNYLPQGWVDDDVSQRVARARILDFVSGKVALPVRPAGEVPATANPYPVPPQAAVEAPPAQEDTSAPRAAEHTG